jgi:hypothetical protein
MNKYIAICLLIILGLMTFALIAAPEDSLNETGKAAMQSELREAEQRRIP